MSAYKLDEIDSGILNIIQKDGETTYKELASILKRSKSNIVERIKNLKKDGFIDRCVVLVDVEKLRSIFTAFPLVQLRNHGQDSIASFKAEMALHAEVMECYHITGNFDFMLKIVTNDMFAYNDFLTEHISPNPLVGKIQSFMVLSQSKRETAYLV
ncbi:MAG: Lrp/AsnC family transcriptional regulator [Sphingobacteriales bacterium]|nr:MAG: Lrp/AsnC family transcriptional regulator [Sphingobacteriales bacterium]